MKRYTAITSTVLIIILTFSTPTLAWNSRGHMMIAAVAYSQLSQQAKDRVGDVLLLNPDWDQLDDEIVLRKPYASANS